MALVGLRSEIHTIHTDLNTLQSSLHKEFSALYATTPVQADAQEKTDIQTLSQTEQTVCCPSNLLRRVQAIEKELPVLEERAVRIRDEKMVSTVCMCERERERVCVYAFCVCKNVWFLFFFLTLSFALSLSVCVCVCTGSS